MGGRNASPARSRVRLIVAAEPDFGARPDPGGALYGAVSSLGAEVDIELVVAIASDDADLAQRLLDAAPNTVSGVRVVECTIGDAESPLSPAAAELAERPSLFTEPGATVAVSTVTGTSRDRRGLRALAALWGLAVLDGDPDEPELAVLIRPPRAACNALLIGALRFTVLEKHASGDADRGLVASGYEGLVVRSHDGGYRTTRAWHSLISDLSLVGLPDFDSACADLLERSGDVVRARLLRDHIRDWNRRRIWDWNYVPEMVLHDEAHSVSVDRHIAAMCEPLLSAREGAVEPLLTTRDVYVLALAAWLHDWGHAGATIGPDLMSDPVDVRRFHGLLTRVRLSDHARLHGLADEEDGAVVDEVGLYSAHHQGWTSAGKADVEAPRATPGTEHWSRPGAPIDPTTFDHDHDAFVAEHPPSAPNREQPQSEVYTGRHKAHLMLALLRLADAMDIGIHRVPHNERREEHLEHVVDDYVSRAMRSAPDAVRELTKLGEKSVAAIQRVLQGTDPMPRTEEEARRLLRTAKDGLPGEVQTYLNAEKSLPRDATKTSQVLVAVYDYVVTHVTTQIVYFEDHAQVRAVVPEWVPATVNGRQGLSLTLHILPTKAEDTSMSGTKRAVAAAAKRRANEQMVAGKRAGETVHRLVVRELALNPNGSQVEGSPMAEMRGHLTDVGIEAWATMKVIDEPGTEPECRPVGSIGGPARKSAALSRPRATAAARGARRPKAGPPSVSKTVEPGASAALLPPGLVVPVAHDEADATDWVGFRQDGTLISWTVPGRTRPITGLPAVADLQAVAATDDGWRVAAIAPAGRLAIQDLRGKRRPIRRSVDAEAVLAVSRDISGYVVLARRADGTVRLLRVPDAPSAPVIDSPAPAVDAAVQGAIIESRAILLGVDGTTTPPGFGLETFWPVHRFDIVTRHTEVLVACVARDRPTEVHTWRTTRRGRGQASMPKLVLATRDPIGEIRWVRDHRASSAPTVMARCGTTWYPSTEQI